MALKLARNADITYTWPVTLDTPADGGRYDKITFQAQFRRLSQGRIDELVALMREPSDGEPRLSDAQIVDEVLVGWAQVLDEAGQPVEFTPVNVAAVMDVPGVRAAMVRAWFDSLSGARRKN